MRTRMKIIVKVTFEHGEDVKLNDIRGSVMRSIQSKLLDHNAIVGGLQAVIVGDQKVSVVEDGM